MGCCRVHSRKHKSEDELHSSAPEWGVYAAPAALTGPCACQDLAAAGAVALF